jgi:hypothetical protein
MAGAALAVRCQAHHVVGFSPLERRTVGGYRQGYHYVPEVSHWGLAT